MSSDTPEANQYTDQDHPWRDESILHELYVERGLTTHGVADILGCAQSTVLDWLGKCEIPTRDDPVGKVAHPELADRDTLYDLYHGEGRSLTEVADRVGCTGANVHHWLKKHEITRRPQPQDTTPSELKNADELRRLYHDEGLTTYEIADRFGCNQSSVHNFLTKHGIGCRTASCDVSYPELEDADTLKKLYHGDGLTCLQIAERIGCGTSTVGAWLENHNIQRRSKGYRVSLPEEVRDPDLLRELYYGEKLNTYEIADRFGCSPTTVCKRMKRYGIDRRTHDEWLEIHEWPTGEDHPLWTGGQFPYGAGWNESKKESVRERDGRTCQNCGLSEAEHIEQYGKKHHVHHIRKARSIDDPERRNHPDNLITLCQSGECHYWWEQMSPLRPQAADDE